MSREDKDSVPDNIEEKLDTESEPVSESKQAEDAEERVSIPRPEYESLQKQAQESKENWDKFLRVYAELENSRKLWERQKQEYIKFGNFRLLKECISVLDEFEEAAKNIEKADSHLAEGVKMTCRKFRDVLKKEDVEEIEVSDSVFDPHIHEAVAVEEREDLPDGSVVEIVQKGYRYRDKILRPVKVKISKKNRR